MRNFKLSVSGLSKNEFDLLSNQRQKSIIDIQAEEDKRVFYMLEMGACRHNEPLVTCTDPECVAEHIHSS
jgi:hypothetical protein